jgi:hydrogenase maturation protease
MKRVLAVCIGNSLVADDAFGSAVFEKLTQENLPANIRLVHLELGGLHLFDMIQGEDLLLVIDAVRFGAPTGTLHLSAWHDLPPADGPPVTSHDIGLRETIEIGYILYPEQMPARTILIGVEGSDFHSVGAPMTPAVAQAAPAAVAAVLRLAEGGEFSSSAELFA